MRRLLAMMILAMAIGCGGGGGGGSADGTAPEGGAAAGGAAVPTTTVVANNPAAPTPAAPAAATQADINLRAAMANAGVQVVQAAPAQDAAKVTLGQALMFDKILSGNMDISCATCHHPTQATGDGLSVSIGTGGSGLGPARTLGAGRNFIARNAPGLFNLAPVNPMFHDGRVSRAQGGAFTTPAGGQLPQGLDNVAAAQAMFPVTDRDEMRGNAGDTRLDGQPNELAGFADNDLTNIWASIMTRLLAIPQYQQMFAAAFPGVPQNQLGFQHAANAIAAFEISQVEHLDSPFDRYVAGDNSALTDAQKRGGQIFYGRGRCSACHRGGLLSDLTFHNIAAPQVGPGKGAEAPLDFGRGRETGQPQDRFRFRTPTLRNVALTGPWMHSGSYTSLQAVVRHYINPGQALNNYNPNQLQPQFRSQVHVTDQLAAGVLNNLDPVLGNPIPLNNGDVDDLVDFLNALTDDTSTNLNNLAPASVPSGLPLD
ncbi:MAG: cytochrome-c peroxidase [Vulcanimicrobiota bacterium]